MQDRMLWDETTSTKDNVTYDNNTGSFTVYHDAFFYVYSQVTLMKDQSTNASFCQCIHRQSDDKTEKLLDGCLPNCEVIIHHYVC